MSGFSQVTRLDVNSVRQKKKPRTEAERKHALAVSEAVRWANRSPLGCRVKRTKKEPYYDYTDRRFHNHPDWAGSLRTTIEGTARDGRSIFIEYLVGGNPKFRRPAKKTRGFMQEMERLGAIVGVAFDYGDVFDIIQGTKRKKRTLRFREEELYGKRKTEENGTEDGPTDGCGGERDSDDVT